MLLLSPEEVLELTRQLQELIPSWRLRERPLANDRWLPFSLD